MSHTTMSFKTLLWLFLLAYLAISNMSTYTVFSANETLKHQSEIVFQFVEHSISDYRGFSDTLNSVYKLFIEGNEFDAIWVDSTTKIELKSDAVKIIEKSICMKVKAGSVHGARADNLPPPIKSFDATLEKQSFGSSGRIPRIAIWFKILVTSETSSKDLRTMPTSMTWNWHVKTLTLLYTRKPTLFFLQAMVSTTWTGPRFCLKLLLQYQMLQMHWLLTHRKWQIM